VGFWYGPLLGLRYLPQGVTVLQWRQP